MIANHMFLGEAGPCAKYDRDDLEDVSHSLTLRWKTEQFIQITSSQ